jgi:hypothetical protein
MNFRRRYITYMVYNTDAEGTAPRCSRFRKHDKALADVERQWRALGGMLRNAEYEAHMFPSRKDSLVFARKFASGCLMAIHDRDTGDTRFYKAGSSKPYKVVHRAKNPAFPLRTA